MTGLIICSYSIVLYTFNDNVTVSAIYQVQIMLSLCAQGSLDSLYSCYIGGLSCIPRFFPVVFSSQVTTWRQLTVDISVLSYDLQYSFKFLRITSIVDQNHLYLNLQYSNIHEKQELLTYNLVSTQTNEYNSSTAFNCVQS